MEKFQDYYRIPSSRASWWNYQSAGVYFITICTANREYFLGEISSGHIFLSDAGQMVLQEWNKSFEIRSELFCDSFVIMPNHIHAILRIVANNASERVREGKEKFGLMGAVTGQSFAETHGLESLQIEQQTEDESLQRKNGVAYRSPKSISSFVAGFKSAATKRINDLKNLPGVPFWQPRFYDRIIRDEVEYWKIVRYIKSNPEKWTEDKYCK